MIDRYVPPKFETQTIPVGPAEIGRILRKELNAFFHEMEKLKKENAKLKAEAKKLST